MRYVRKNSTVANPAKKSLTVFQNSYQVLDHYDIQYGTREVPVYTNVTGFLWEFNEGCCNTMNVPVTFYGVSAWHLYGGGSHYYGTVTVGVNKTPEGTWFHKYADSGYANCKWKYSYAMVGNRRFEHPLSYAQGKHIANVGQVQTGTRTEQYEVSRTPVYRTDWNTKWSKRSA